MRWLPVLMITGLLLVTACSSDDNSATPGTTERATTTSTTSPVPPAAIPDDIDVAVDWTLEETIPGFLVPVGVDTEFVGLYSEADRAIGDLWTSADGIDWMPAPSPPFEHPRTLEVIDGRLYATSDTSLHMLSPEGVWLELMSAGFPGGYAVGPDYTVAYRNAPAFHVVEVRDTTTNEPIDIEEWPEPGDWPDVGPGAVVDGHVVAVDDGFIAHTTRMIGPDELGGRHLLWSEDGITWTEHPAPPEDLASLMHSVRFGDRAIVSGLTQPDGPYTESSAALWLNEGGPDLDSTTFPGGPTLDLVEVLGPTRGGEVVVSDGAQSPWATSDGRNWLTFEAPSTWYLRPIEGDGALGHEGLAAGTVLMTDDRMLAYTVRGELGAFGYVGDPVTEIWTAPIPAKLQDL